MLRPGGPLSDEAAAALRAHPRFGEAVRLAAGGLVELYQGNALLNLLVNDRGRLLISYFALHLHFGGHPPDQKSGLTLTRLQDLCVESDVCSRGRAAAMVAVMRAAGYLAVVQGTGDRRERRLMATELLIASQRERWRCQFRAIALLMPELAPVLEVLERADFVEAFIQRLGALFRAGVRVLAGARGLQLFAERNAGMSILFALLAAGTEGQGAPSTVSISISALARRFGVSRAHVLKLLRDAESRGFLRRTGSAGESIVVLPPLTDAADRFFATVFLFFALCAREALEAMEASREPTRAEAGLAAMG
jgi:DNA-binding MarR family transcriptional regulator